MSKINFKDKRILEKLFEMDSGYVLDFSNRTFRDFFIDELGVDMYAEKYEFRGESKAHRLRAFWEIESDFNIGKSIESLAEYWLALIHSGVKDLHHTTELLYKESLEIAKRLKQGHVVQDLDVFRENVDDIDFNKLARIIKDHIENNQPEVALDRLHTYMTKYVKTLCYTHQIDFMKEETLNAIFGKYIKFLRVNNKLESEMSERILKYSMNVLDAFNDIRNNKSFAHDNPILNYEESVLIFKSITSSIRFIETIESKVKQQIKTEMNSDIDGLPF